MCTNSTKFDLGLYSKIIYEIEFTVCVIYQNFFLYCLLHVEKKKFNKDVEKLQRTA